MNYNNITNDWDMMVRDAIADLPAPTDEELDEMIESLRNEFGESEDDGEGNFRGYTIDDEGEWI